MNNITFRSGFLIAALLGVFLSIGCQTPDPNAPPLTAEQREAKAVKFAAILETATSTGAYLVISNNPDYRDSVVSAAGAIRAVTNGGGFDRQSVIAAILASSDDGEAIALGLEGALALYGAFLSDNTHLPAESLLPYASIVLNGIARGAETGARLTAPPPPATNEIPPGFFRL